MKIVQKGLFRAASILLACFVSVNIFSQQIKLELFPLSAIRLEDSLFRKAQHTDLGYMLSLNPDRLLAPYLREAGLTPKAQTYGNWESSGLDGHIGGHYLSALSNMYAATGDNRLLQRLTYMVDELNNCQLHQEDGYLGGTPGGKKMWQEIAAGKIEAQSFSLNGKWVPLYNLHKTFAGLIDAYTIANLENAKPVLLKLSGWFANIINALSDEQVQSLLKSEHGGINEIFVDVALISNDRNYIDLARRLSHKTLLQPLLNQSDALNGMHANTQIPKAIGFARVAQQAGDKAWFDAAAFFWSNVALQRSISIGGNSVREHFHPADDFSSMTETREGPETCNTYNMLELSKYLYLSTPSSNYIDYYERAVYNHILSSQHPDGGFVYFTPIRPRHYRVYSQPDEGFWCCVGTGLENHGKYGELIYAHNGNDLFVNLFISSSLTWSEKGMKVIQRTQFPYEERSSVRVELDSSRSFSVYLRYPSWVKDGKMQVRVNNIPVKVTRNGDDYVKIERRWTSGDEISMVLPMHTTAEFLPDKSPWVSFVHGPIVLAAITDTTDLNGIRADDSRMGHIAHGPLYPIEKAPLVVTDRDDFASMLKPVAGKPLTFTAKSILYPRQSQDLQLVPFFSIHDARYMLYWRHATPVQLEELNNELKKREEALQALEKITIDQVTPGEQQPETEHKFRGERTETGMRHDRHSRTAKGWFSYELTDAAKESRALRLTFHGGDRNTDFQLYVNGALITTIQSKMNQGGKFYDVDYDLPTELIKQSGGKLVVKLEAVNGSVAGPVYDIRLVR